MILLDISLSEGKDRVVTGEDGMLSCRLFCTVNFLAQQTGLVNCYRTFLFVRPCMTPTSAGADTEH